MLGGLTGISDRVDAQTLNQVVCDPPGNAWPVATAEWQCFNSAHFNHGKPADFSKCSPAQITDTIAPFQQQYIDEYKSSGMAAKSGNGGFFHSCWVGAAWSSYTPTQSYWNVVKVGGISMEQAVSKWWAAPATAPAAFIQDCLWTTAGEELMMVAALVLPCARLGLFQEICSKRFVFMQHVTFPLMSFDVRLHCNRQQDVQPRVHADPAVPGRPSLVDHARPVPPDAAATTAATGPAGLPPAAFGPPHNTPTYPPQSAPPQVPPGYPDFGRQYMIIPEPLHS